MVVTKYHGGGTAFQGFRHNYPYIHLCSRQTSYRDTLFADDTVRLVQKDTPAFLYFQIMHTGSHHPINVLTALDNLRIHLSLRKSSVKFHYGKRHVTACRCQFLTDVLYRHLIFLYQHTFHLFRCLFAVSNPIDYLRIRQVSVQQ